MAFSDAPTQSLRYVKHVACQGCEPLVKVQASEDSGAVTIQTAEFDGEGRRIKKTATSSGKTDGAVVYLCHATQLESSGLSYSISRHGKGKEPGTNDQGRHR